MSAFILGSTGLVGCEILRHAEVVSVFSRIRTLGRVAPQLLSSKVTSIENSNLQEWPAIIEREAKGCTTFFSAFGTTRGNAGLEQAFIDVDYGVNYNAARLAKAAGVQTFVLISSMGASSSSVFLYPRTKGKLEEDVIALQFPRTIILRPGILLGNRRVSQGILNEVAVRVSRIFHRTVFDFLAFPVDASDLARIAVQLATEPVSPATPPTVRIVSPREITRLAISAGVPNQ